MSTEAPDDLRPFLVYRRDGESLECAVWNLEQGDKCLALFLTAENAEAYIRSAPLDAHWRVFQPSAGDLLEILKQSRAAQIRFAVLDPDETQGKRLFDIGAILQQGEGPSDTEKG